MRLFNGLVKTLDVATDVLTTPVEMAKDAFTLGGELSDQEGSYSVRRLRKVVEGVKDIPESFDD